MIKETLMPLAAQMATSPRLRSWMQTPVRIKQQFTKQKPLLTFFHQLDNPYSYLALEMATHLIHRYDLNLSVHVVNDKYTGVVAEEKWYRYRLHDARRLARIWNVSDFVTLNSPNPTHVNRALDVLPNLPRANYINAVLQLSRAVWSRQRYMIDELSDQYGRASGDAVAQHLTQSHKLRESLGHYDSAMWHFAGDWFWGLDRLQLLEEKLIQWGLNKGGNTVVAEQYEPSRVLPVQGHQLDVFFSFRSPYSYLALPRIFDIHRQHRDKLMLRLRPVKPMVERGVALSTLKRKYILTDAARLARQYEIPFGRICDPLGPGISHCISLLHFAQQKNLGHRLVTIIMRGIWSEGANINRQSVLAKLVERSGLSWNEAKMYLENTEALHLAEKNREQLELMGLWGVPTFAITDAQNRLQSVYWGQDRITWLQYGFNAHSI